MIGKRAILCVILTSMLVVIGCSSDDDGDEAEINGTWESASMTLNKGGITVTNVLFTLIKGGFYTMSFSGGGANVEQGTFTPVELPENTDITLTVVASTGTYTKSAAATWRAKYTDFSSSTLNFYMDRVSPAVGYEGPYAMTRR